MIVELSIEEHLRFVAIGRTGGALLPVSEDHIMTYKASVWTAQLHGYLEATWQRL